MQKFIRSVVLATAVVACFASDGAAAKKEIRIGTEGAYEPFNYIDPSGKLKGFDVDIARALCAEMKADCKFITQAWDGIIPGLLLRKYDAIVASMAITPARLKKVDFSKPYYMTPARFVAPKGVKVELTKEWLKGKTVGVQKATTHSKYMADNWASVVNLKQYDTQENANLDLKAGRVDLVLADSAVMWPWLQKEGKEKFAYSGPDITDERWFGKGAGIAVRKGETELAEDFNQALAKIQANGTYEKIRKKYFPFKLN